MLELKYGNFFSVFFIFLISFPLLWNNIKPYQQKRILSFLNPESDPLGQGYQLIQSKIALGSGGLSGKGILQGTQSYLEYLPEKQTDFIFTLIGEEFGFIGTIFIIILFIFLILISYYISFRSNNVFGRVLSIGVSINLFLYVDIKYCNGDWFNACCWHTSSFVIIWRNSYVINNDFFWIIIECRC